MTGAGLKKAAYTVAIAPVLVLFLLAAPGFARAQFAPPPPPPIIILVVPANHTALNSQIGIATAALVGVTEGTLPGQHTPGSIAALNAAITAANAAMSSGDQSAVNSATTALMDALAAFNASIVSPSNVLALNAEITAANTTLASSTEGTTPGQHTIGSSAVLAAAIAAASALSANNDQASIDAATTMLSNAIAAFNAAIVPLSDTSVLATEVILANTALVGVVEGATPGNHLVGSSATLATAIAVAQAVTGAQPQLTVNTAAATLAAALAAFNAAVVPPSNLTTLNAEIGIANAALVGVVEGVVPGNHIVGSSATLTNAVNIALALTTSSPQTTIDAEVVTLTAAVAVFNAAIVPPPVTFALVATSGTNGSVTPLGTTTVASGASQTYTITPAAGYDIASLTIDGTAIATSTTYTFAAIAAAHTIDAQFSVQGAVLPVVLPSTPVFVSANPVAGTISPLTSATIQWADATDVGGPGIGGYAFLLDSASTTVPGVVINTAATSTTFAVLPYNTYYFHVRSVDTSGSVSPSAVYGPIILSDSNVLYTNSTIGGTYYGVFSPTLAQAVAASTTGSTITGSTLSTWWDIASSTLTNVLLTNSSVTNSTLSNTTLINAVVVNNVILSGSIIPVGGGAPIIIATSTPLANLLNYPPIASFSTTAAGLAVTITDASSDANSGGTLGDSWNYTWNFGDGSGATTTVALIGDTPAHTYAAAGTYTVTLTLTDSFGLVSTFSTPVTVAALPVAPGGGAGAGGSGAGGAVVNNGSIGWFASLLPTNATSSGSILSISAVIHSPVVSTTTPARTKTPAIIGKKKPGASVAPSSGVGTVPGFVDLTNGTAAVANAQSSQSFLGFLRSLIVKAYHLVFP